MVVGHPQWENSFGNKTIVKNFVKANPEVVVTNLIVEYPDGKIDVESEQFKIMNADTIILQFPIEWYGAPSIMHKWFEDVLAYGFAFGRGGDKCKGKRLIASFTTGSPASDYVQDGPQCYPIDKYMYPFIALAHKCQMEWDGYVYTGGIMAPFADSEQLKQMELACIDHAKRLTDKIK